jgi:hypothetical protein
VSSLLLFIAAESAYSWVQSTGTKLLQPNASEGGGNSYAARFFKNNVTEARRPTALVTVAGITFSRQHLAIAFHFHPLFGDKHGRLHYSKGRMASNAPAVS